LLDEATEGRIQLLVPDVVLDELRRVLSEKLGFVEPRIREAEDFLRTITHELLPAAGLVDPLSGDASDDAILACAVEAGAHVLATGDRKHLLPIGELRGVRLLTPQAVLAELRAGER